MTVSLLFSLYDRGNALLHGKRDRFLKRNLLGIGPRGGEIARADKNSFSRRVCVLCIRLRRIKEACEVAGERRGERRKLPIGFISPD